MVGYLLTHLLQLYCKVWWQKYFENWLAFCRVTGKNKVALFFYRTRCSVQYNNLKYSYATMQHYKSIQTHFCTAHNTTHTHILQQVPAHIRWYMWKWQICAWLDDTFKLTNLPLCNSVCLLKISHKELNILVSRVGVSIQLQFSFSN